MYQYISSVFCCVYLCVSYIANTWIIGWHPDIQPPHHSCEIDWCLFGVVNLGALCRKTKYLQLKNVQISYRRFRSGALWIQSSQMSNSVLASKANDPIKRITVFCDFSIVSRLLWTMESKSKMRTQVFVARLPYRLHKVCRYAREHVDHIPYRYICIKYDVRWAAWQKDL